MDISSALPANFNIMTENQQLEVMYYLNSLDDIQLKSYITDIQQSGSSFNLFKSEGYKEWKNKTD
jgi:hypothetical protein